MYHLNSSYKTLAVDEPVVRYRENLLHWIWESLYFDFQNLRTIDGDQVRVIDVGHHNESDGPDFTRSQLVIGGLTWHGDVEIHWEERDWFRHRHHEDPAYNKVILHLVYEQPQLERSTRLDGTRLPVLCLRPYLTKPLAILLERLHYPETLPCAGRRPLITEAAFNRQLRRVRDEYFEEKVDQIMSYYNPELPPSEAWKRALVIALFDGLGITHNRDPMRQLAVKLMEEPAGQFSRGQLVSRALTISGLDSEDPAAGSFTWKRKGARPANHPRPRIRQGAQLIYGVYQRFSNGWIRDEPEAIWRDILEQVTTTPGLGRQRANLLFHLVLLPALYLYGSLYRSANLMKTARDRWNNGTLRQPQSVLAPLTQTHLPRHSYRDNLATAYQIKKYCRPRRCQHCEVLKPLINS